MRPAPSGPAQVLPVPRTGRPVSSSEDPKALARRERYAQDEAYREAIRAASRERRRLAYQTDPRYRARVIEQKKTWRASGKRNCKAENWRREARKALGRDASPEAIQAWALQQIARIEEVRKQRAEAKRQAAEAKAAEKAARASMSKEAAIARRKAYWAWKAAVRDGNVAASHRLCLAEQNQIALLYAEAKRLSDETGTPHHVDHIVPMRSYIATGLHCLANLRVVPAGQNLTKGRIILTEEVPEVSIPCPKAQKAFYLENRDRIDSARDLLASKGRDARATGLLGRRQGHKVKSLDANATAAAA